MTGSFIQSTFNIHRFIDSFLAYLRGQENAVIRLLVSRHAHTRRASLQVYLLRQEKQNTQSAQKQGQKQKLAYPSEPKHRWAQSRLDARVQSSGLGPSIGPLAKNIKQSSMRFKGRYYQRAFFFLEFQVILSSIIFLLSDFPDFVFPNM